MQKIEVSIVYACKQQQWLKELTIQRGASVSDLIEQSGFLNEIDDLLDQSIEELSVGIYAKKTTLDELLENGDRVEIYRPLKADPKDVRRQLAELGKTMGSK